MMNFTTTPSSLRLLLVSALLAGSLAACQGDPPGDGKGEDATTTADGEGSGTTTESGNASTTEPDEPDTGGEGGTSSTSGADMSDGDTGTGTDARDTDDPEATGCEGCGEDELCVGLATSDACGGIFRGYELHCVPRPAACEEDLCVEGCVEAACAPDHACVPPCEPLAEVDLWCGFGFGE